jgi:hypothetical protein
MFICTHLLTMLLEKYEVALTNTRDEWERL